MKYKKNKIKRISHFYYAGQQVSNLQETTDPTTSTATTSTVSGVFFVKKHSN